MGDGERGERGNHVECDGVAWLNKIHIIRIRTKIEGPQIKASIQSVVH